MASRHTPGPWEVVKGQEADDWGVTEVSKRGSSSIAQMVWENDARLIAAAPELLEACQLVLSGAEDHGLFVGKSQDPKFYVRFLRAVIAKVEVR